MTTGKIVVLATGGTLAGVSATERDNVGYTAAELGIAEILARLPALVAMPLVSEQVAQIDSREMSFDIWSRLAQRCRHWLAQQDVAGIVITHGTDTIEETAFFLHCVLPTGKPVVLTCAMRPANALVADGPQNIVDAVTVAGAHGANGVVVVCAGTVHSAVDVTKVHTYRPDAFSSGDAGPLGTVEEGVLHLWRAWPQAPIDAGTAFTKFTQAAAWPRVEIVMNHAGASGAIVDALRAQGVDGIVVAGTGNGSVNGNLEAALLAAQAAGVKVARSTRVAQGRVIAHGRDVLPDSRGLSPVKARIAMVLQLLA